MRVTTRGFSPRCFSALRDQPGASAISVSIGASARQPATHYLPRPPLQEGTDSQTSSRSRCDWEKGGWQEWLGARQMSASATADRGDKRREFFWQHDRHSSRSTVLQPKLRTRQTPCHVCL